MVIADGVGCCNGKHLIESAHSTRQCDKNVAFIEHQLLALTEIVARQHPIVILRRTPRLLHD